MSDSNALTLAWNGLKGMSSKTSWGESCQSGTGMVTPEGAGGALVAPPLRLP